VFVAFLGSAELPKTTRGLKMHLKPVQGGLAVIWLIPGIASVIVHAAPFLLVFHVFLFTIVL